MNLLEFFRVDLVYHRPISFLHQARVNPGVFLDVSVGDHFAIGPDHLDLITSNEVDRLSRTRVNRDRRPGRNNRSQFPSLKPGLGW